MDGTSLAGVDSPLTTESNQEVVLKVVRSVQPPVADYATRLESLFNTSAYSDICRKVLGPRSERFSTTCHGSPWASNAVFWYTNGTTKCTDSQPKEVMLQNFQQVI